MIFNFNQGSGTDFTKATATVDDVAAGKTFFAGNKGLKTGTLKKQQFAAGEITIPYQAFGSYHSIDFDCGFKPTKIFIQRGTDNKTDVRGYLESGQSAIVYMWNIQNNTFSGNGDVSITDNGFVLRHQNNNTIYNVAWCAVKE